MAPNHRLSQLLNEFGDKPVSIGKLKLGGIEFEVPASATPTRLSHLKEDNILDLNDRFNLDNLHFMLQKYLLGQDIFLVSQPGPYARRLALTFARIINSEYEYIALHRDVGETELKQGREIRRGGNLVYVDSPAVSAVKYGRLLILEGIEKAERGIMPVLNNLLENREMNLDDGSHIIHSHRYQLMDRTKSEEGKVFIPAHKNFRVIAIAAPVPPYPGYPLDPPFRSRFQARFIDPIGSLLALTRPKTLEPMQTSSSLYNRLKDVILSTQLASETRGALDAVSKTSLPPFPQTALAKLQSLIASFPPPPTLSSSQLTRLLLALHPALVYAPSQARALLSRQTEKTGLGKLDGPSVDVQEEGLGFFGFQVISIIPKTDSSNSAMVTFSSADDRPPVTVVVPSGPRKFRSVPFEDTSLDFKPTPRFMGLLTCLLQAHTLSWDISLIPPAQASTSSTSTSTLVRVFAEVLGYELEAIHMYKELGGREMIMRRQIEEGGATSWEPSNLIRGLASGALVHLSSLDVVGSTAGSLARLVQDRETELWEGKRIVGEASPEEIEDGNLEVVHTSLRIISTASKSTPLKDWLSDEHANMFFAIPCQPMGADEERALLSAAACPRQIVDTLLSFAHKYRQSISSDNIIKNRKMGTRTLLRLALKLAYSDVNADMRAVIEQALLAEFLPAAERMTLYTMLDELNILKQTPVFNPDSYVEGDFLVFPCPTGTDGHLRSLTKIPLFRASQDPDGVASHVPQMDHFYNNSLQTGLMRVIGVDLVLLKEHVVLLGNQGVGKNKIVDKLCQLLNQPREYVQLHRDTTVAQLMFTTSLDGGVLNYKESPLIRAIKHGRFIIVDEADKAPEHVVAVFKSLAGQGELSLSDGRRVVRTKERSGDIVIHENFRLILLANRPGYPFLGNHFLQVLGENFSAHSVSNPDQASERKLISQLAPELDEDLVLRLVGAFHDLRKGYEDGQLTYPYSLRELISLVRHLKAYPSVSLGDALRNIFDFDIYKPETIQKLSDILEHHGLQVPHLGLDAARNDAEKQKTIEFNPKDAELNGPKEGKHDDDEHSGGNMFAGGVGGRDTSGIGGRGGYKRLLQKGSIKQNSSKQNVPDHIPEQAREMARIELQRRLEELDMSASQARGYESLLNATQAHMAALLDLLEHLAAREEERVWLKRQTDGELDDSRLTEGLTGESTVYKRRGMEKPEIGRPQIKPKRIKFIFDLSASMYRFQYDGRLQRSTETAAMLMETFDRLSRKDKYIWDMCGHSGEGPDITLVSPQNPPTEVKDRWKVVEKMLLVPQYAFAGDYTVEAITKGVAEVSKFDADDWFVIAITDANFGRYAITQEDLTRAMKYNPKVKTSLICIGEGAEAAWVTKCLPGQAFRINNTSDIPTVLRSILSTLVDR